VQLVATVVDLNDVIDELVLMLIKPPGVTQ